MSSSTPLNEPVISQLDNRLLGARVRSEIMKAIVDGRLSGKLPSEDRLAEMLNVSRTTVRTAMQSLERDGVITRRRAIGTIVNAHFRPSSLTLQRLMGFDSLLEERGYQVDVKTSWQWGVAGDEFAAAFGIDADLECCLIQKEYRADGTFALMITDAVRRDDVLEDRLGTDVEASLFEFSEARCRAPIHHAVVDIVPMVAHKGVSRLDLPKDTPFIRLLETHYTANGNAMAYSVIDANNSFIHLQVVRTP